MRHSPVFEFNQDEDDVLMEAISWKEKTQRKPITIDSFTKDALYQYAAETVNAKRKYLMHRAVKESDDGTARRCCNCIEYRKEELFINKMRRKPCSECHGKREKPSFKPARTNRAENGGIKPSKLKINYIGSTIRHRAGQE